MINEGVQNVWQLCPWIFSMLKLRISANTSSRHVFRFSMSFSSYNSAVKYFKVWSLVTWSVNLLEGQINAFRCRGSNQNSTDPSSHIRYFWTFMHCRHDHLQDGETLNKSLMLCYKANLFFHQDLIMLNPQVVFSFNLSLYTYWVAISN